MPGGVISLPGAQSGLTGGYSDHIDIGGGTGRPSGVESAFEYNGSLLNVRNWVDTILINQIDGLADPDVRDAREVNPGRHGETYFNAFYGGRTIVLTGRIRAHTLSKLREMQMGLKQVFGDISKELPLTFRTGNINRDVMIYCKKSQPIVMAEVQQNFMYERDFQVTLRASNPHFLSYMESMIYMPFGYLEPFSNQASVDLTNLLPNPSFEVNSTGWSATPSSAGLTAITFAIQQGWSAQGVSSLRYTVQRNDASVTTVFAGFTPSGTSGIPVTPGQPYYVAGTFNVLTSDSPNGVRIRVNWFKADGTASSVSVFSAPTYSTGLGVKSSSIVATAPSDAAFAQIVFQTVLGGTGSTTNFDAYLDGAMFVQTSVNTSYFDGDAPYGRWTGTPHASTSEHLSLTGLESIFTVSSNAGRAWAQGNKLRAQGPSPPGTVGRIVIMNQINATQLANQRVAIDYTPDATLSTAFTSETAVIVKYLDANNFIWCRTNHTINGPYLQIYKNDGGNTKLAEGTGLTALVAGTAYTVRGTINDNVITAEHYRASDGAQLGSLTFTLTGADATKFGAGVKGGNGLRITAPSTGWTYDNVYVESVSITNQVAFTVTNEGNAPALPRIKIFGPLSAASTGGNAISLLNDADPSALIKINAKTASTLAIADGNYIEIDTDKRTLKEYDSSGSLISNSFNQLDVASNWLKLMPGQNPIEVVTYATSQPKLEMRHRHTFL